MPYCRATIWKYSRKVTQCKHGRPTHSGKSTDKEVLKLIDAIFENNPTTNLLEAKQLIKNYLDISLSTSQLSKVKNQYLFYTFKRTSKIATQRKTKWVQMKRTTYRRVIQTKQTKLLFFIDESHVCYDHLVRTYGYSKKGQPCSNIAHRVSGKRYSLLACINKVVGLVYYEFIDTTKKAIDAERFNLFLGKLRNYMPRGSILVLDNASIHKDEFITPFMNAKGVYVYWQSPYSPDFNPIELVFGWIKKKLKEYEYATELLPAIIEEVMAAIKPKLVASFVKHCRKVWKNEALK